jgi:hypothetical protein
MNKRLRELMKQADYPAPEIALRAQKLAELIVRECINEIAYIGKANEVFGDRTDRGGLNHILWTTETAIEKIKQHFGVEE